MAIVSNINQLGGYPYLVPCFSEAAFENGTCFKFTSYLFDSFCCPLVSHDGSTRNDVQPLTPESVEIISSVIPSAKYESPGSGLMLAKGRTAILLLSGSVDWMVFVSSHGSTIL